MATHDLSGKKIAILATDGFERSELHEPKKALEQAGAKVVVIAPHEGSIRAMNHHDWADELAVDATVASTSAADYDALVLPGGVMNPDQLRMDRGAVELVRSFVAEGKPIGAICHGPWTLIEADAVRGRTVTSYPSLRTDLTNAGAKWVDQQVVEDRGLVTSRNPGDLPAFGAKLIEVIAQGASRRTERSREQPRA